MILIINTSEPDRLEVYLVKGGKVIAKKLPIAFNESEKLLSLIDSLLKKAGVDLESLKGVGVVTGPGGFTALRIGVTVANTLAWGLKIPAVGVTRNEIGVLRNEGCLKDIRRLVALVLTKLKGTKVGQLVKPFYGQEPKITKPKE